MKHPPSILTAFLLLLVISCSSSNPSGVDPPGFTCEYHPAGTSTVSLVQPSPQELGEFDNFARVRVTGHRQPGSSGTQFNAVTIDDAVFGSFGDGDTLELQSGTGICLETGASYFLLFDSPDFTGLSSINIPWVSFPVINNRITLHQDMRKDELIGDFHGLDPVLFKRRFIDYVGRTDVEVD